MKIEYDGSSFVGWQRQMNGLGIQQVLEEAVEQLCNEEVSIQCAGRTDAGVHALGQVAHFDIAEKWDAWKLRDGINHYLKRFDISILEVAEADIHFNARFDAVQRCYLYRIISRRAPVALDKGRVWWVPAQLDSVAMQQAGKLLLGKHDFSTFRASDCQSKTPVKTLDELSVRREGDEIRVFTSARSFLYHQVRNIVGTLRLVGQKKWSLKDFGDAFDAKDRTRGGPTAPASGLYFADAKYR